MFLIKKLDDKINLMTSVSHTNKNAQIEWRRLHYGNKKHIMRWDGYLRWITKTTVCWQTKRALSHIRQNVTMLLALASETEKISEWPMVLCRCYIKEVV